MKRILKNSEHMSRINYLDNFIEENYGQMKKEKKKTEWLVTKWNMSY